MPDSEKDYTLDAFKRICNQTLLNLPEEINNESLSIENRHELALEQLLANIQKYTNTSAIKLGLPEMSKTSYLKTQIIHLLEHDWSLYGLDKNPIIQDFLEKGTK